MFNPNNKHIIRKVDRKAFTKILNAMTDNYVNIIFDEQDVKTIYIQDSKNLIQTQTRN